MTNPLVIIAEDNPGLARVLSLKLKSSGFEPLMCSDGQFAWEAFQDNSVAAIMSDQEMPRMTGVELCRQVRAIDQDVPFLLVTGRKLELDTKELEEELNICQVFGKPFSPSEVISVLRQAISENSTAC
ncbi:MAG: response regulator [Rubripirellula sp.]|nr:response regulator [Rubripirellula sp.]